MSRRERDKGRKAEREVARLYESHGLTVRGLEGGGDHLIVDVPGSRLRLHSEVKRQEVARPWLWYEQATAEAPPGSMPVVHFRRNRSPWLVLFELDGLLAIIADYRSRGRRIAELELELEALRSGA